MLKICFRCCIVIALLMTTACMQGNYIKKSGQISEKFVPLKRPFDLKNGKVGIACRSELHGGEESVYQAIKNGGLTKRVEFIERTEGLEEDYDYMWRRGVPHYKHCTIVYGE
ncbi:MAG: hypothetical protein IJ590_00230 [Rickettsiales bacterium]|nr:hypothetical protein [Rickettsiales bacterium]